MPPPQLSGASRHSAGLGPQQGRGDEQATTGTRLSRPPEGVQPVAQGLAQQLASQEDSSARALLEQRIRYEEELAQQRVQIARQQEVQSHHSVVSIEVLTSIPSAGLVGR